MSELVSAVLKLIGSLVLLAGMAFATPLLGVVFGAFTGWVVGMFFPNTLHHVLGQIIPNFGQTPIWEMGATLGFIGGFFKTSVSQKSNEE